MERDTSRVEAFSDGVFAIAITLLILELHVPRMNAGASNGNLSAALMGMWPSFVAFLMSFFVILMMWISHHGLLRLVQSFDYSFFFANGFLLLMVTFVPFPTAVLAEHLGSSASNAAAAFYCGTFCVVSIAFNLLFRTVARNRRLVHDHVTDQVLARIHKAYRLGLPVYAVSVAVSLWNAPLGLAVCCSLWAVWIRLCYTEPTSATAPDRSPAHSVVHS